jgi:hypothetical protein
MPARRLHSRWRATQPATALALSFLATGGDWGTITHIGIMDASTAGNMIIHAPLTVAKAISDGDVFRIPTGDLDVTLN